jgi:hypothetical protein
VLNTLPTTLVAVAILACGFTFGLTFILLRKIGYLQRTIERRLENFNAQFYLNRAQLLVPKDSKENNSQSLSNDKLDIIINLLQSLKCEIGQEIKKLSHVERTTAEPQGISHIQESTQIEQQSRTTGGSMADVSSGVTALQVGEAALALLDREGRTNAIASIPGLTAWLNTNWNGFVAEAILSREEAWLVVVLNRPDEKRGIVIPALDTVIGAGVVSDWFECRGYDGTRVLNRQNVLQLAEAVRDAIGKPWQVSKKGLISEIGEGN